MNLGKGIPTYHVDEILETVVCFFLKIWTKRKKKKLTSAGLYHELSVTVLTGTTYIMHNNTCVHT